METEEKKYKVIIKSSNWTFKKIAYFIGLDNGNSTVVLCWTKEDISFEEMFEISKKLIDYDIFKPDFWVVNAYINEKNMALYKALTANIKK